MSYNEITIITIILLILLNITFLYFFIKYKKKDSNNIQFYLERQFSEILNSLNHSILFFNKNDELVFFNDYASENLSLKIINLGLNIKEIFNNNKLTNSYRQLSNPDVFDITYNKKIYLVQIYEVKTNLFTNYVNKIVILNNVTEDRKIEETKRDFFSHASHELKSPLTAILGYSELISLNMIEEAEIVSTVKKIYNQAAHMSLLVEEMGALARLESMNERIEFYEVTSLNQILKDVLITLEPFIKEKNLYIDLLERPVSYNCIKLDINKLFKNLIENAIKYSPSDSMIKIKLDKEGNYINFSVEDEGIGIEKSHLDRIFERFYRVDKGRIDPGTGLGLAIVKHTVIKYQGTIDIKSKLNEGTTIKLKLKV